MVKLSGLLRFHQRSQQSLRTIFERANVTSEFSCDVSCVVAYFHAVRALKSLQREMCFMHVFSDFGGIAVNSVVSKTVLQNVGLPLC